MSRILLFAPWARYTPHFETDLELIQLHLDAGDEVHFIGCDAELLACDRNPHHDLVRCTVCVGRRESGLALLGGSVERLALYNLTDADRAELKSLPSEFDDVEDLKALRVEEFDVGYAVLSTMVSFLRDPEPLAERNRQCLRDLIVSAVAVYRSFCRHLADRSYDRVYIFNGRFAITRAVLRACQSRGVACFTHERGHDHGHYALFENTTVHDLTRMDRAIRRAWDGASDPAERDRIGARFYEDRAGGKEQGWFSFTADQDVDLLPRGFDPSRRNVVLFNSSEDEFVAIGDAWRHPLYASQQEGVERISAALACEPDLHLYLRVHPNLRDVDNEQTRAIAALDAPNLTVIPADSPVGTYALLRAAWKVVTFGSTVGMEAVFWGIPSVLAGQCFYRRLGGVYVPETHDELVEMVRGPLEPGPREPALMYGYHLSTFGTPYRHYQSEGVFDGRFRGRSVAPGPIRLGTAALLRVASPLERALRWRAREQIRAGLEGK